MNYKKFDSSDILRNTIKTYPKNSIFIDNTGSVYIKNLSQFLYSDNKNSNLVANTNFNFLNQSNYNRSYEVSEKYDFYLPNKISAKDVYRNSDRIYSGFLTSSISVYFITSSKSDNFYDEKSLTGISSVNKVSAMKNTIDSYSRLSQHFSSSYFLPKYNAIAQSSTQLDTANIKLEADIDNICILNIPSVFYGSEIRKGSVKLDFYITGTLIGSLSDVRQNGELIEVSGSNIGNTAGVILYSEGIMLITGSWSLINSNRDNYIYFTGSNNIKTVNLDFPRWIHWGKSYISSSLLNSSSYNLEFEGTNYLNTITMFTHAHKNEFNMTNNKTAIDQTQDKYDYFVTGTNNYIENREILFKNTIKTPYSNFSGSFKKQSFITKVGIYDENKKLIGIAKLATPVKKNNEREYTIKLKLDY